MSIKHLQLALFAFIIMGCGTDEVPATQANILFILADDLGYEMISSYGGLEVETPHIDRLAETGTRFTRAYTSPVCTPSRMSIYTGLYAPHHGFTQVIPIHQGSRYAVDFQHMRSYPQLLQKAGYHTAVTGKWQLAALEYHPDHCKQAGFDSWCVWQIWKDEKKTKRHWEHTYNQDGTILPNSDSTFGPDVMAEYVIGQMARAKAKHQPFYIHHNMVLPHTPIVATPNELHSKQAPSLNHMIQYMDAIVGRLVAAVDSLGLSDNTYIIFAGDNGTELKTARQTVQGEVTGGKWDLNEGGMHVPLIIQSPKNEQKLLRQDLIDFADFFPTICDLAGVDIPGDIHIDGLSFAASISGENSRQRKWVTGAVKTDFVVFDGKWRLHHQAQQLVDCRDLPKERSITPTASKEEQEAMNSLLSVIDLLRKNDHYQKMDKPMLFND